MADDLERLAELPDGTLSINVLEGRATHSVAGEQDLYIARELNAWLKAQLIKHAAEGELQEVILKADIQTDRIATDRKRIVSFDFKCESFLRSRDKSYCGALAEKHTWHRRISA